MALNPGYGIEISPKQSHLRHHLHAKRLFGVWDLPRIAAGISKRYASKTSHPIKSVITKTTMGSGVHPRMRLWSTKRYACQTRPTPKTGAIKPDVHTNSYIPQSESAVIHSKILTQKSESVLIHFLRQNPLHTKSSRMGVKMSSRMPGSRASQPWMTESFFSIVSPAVTSRVSPPMVKRKRPETT